MDGSQSGRGDLTEEQWAQRVAWAHKMWDADYYSREWQTVAHCIVTVRSFDPKWAHVPPSYAFKEPHQHNDFLDAVFEEYISRKLIGEAP